MISLSSTSLFATEFASMTNDSSSLLTLNAELERINAKKIYEEKKKIKSQSIKNNEWNISNYHVNRIVTPFKNPSLKLDSVQGVTHMKRGNVIYLSTTSQRRIGGFITELGNESEAVRVIFVPKRIPPQEVVIGGQYNNGTSVARNFERSQPRIDTLKEVLATIAKGEIPRGYAEQNLNATYLPNCNQKGLTFNFFSGQLLSGGYYMVSIGVVENTSSNVIELLENNCHSMGVVAVAAYPETTLIPHGKSEVFVMFNRANNRSSVKPRQSLLGKELIND